MGLNQQSIRLLAALSVVVVVSLATAPITMASTMSLNHLPLAGPADPNAINPSSVVLPSGQVIVKPSGPGTVMGANAEAISAQPDLQTRFGNSQFAAPQAAAAAGSKPSGAESMPGGVDVRGWQANADWQTVWNQGARFAYIKASEGPWTMNDYFAQQYNGQPT
ncbi:lysozyme M1 [Renibacterium salmoninarum ATCC 33209]|uniref:Lysozyme M1 n=1 Tax=Renibacterium salmoninarum (strain ATCC 33209 / DSM 20767 / JCM 11484 / NBRC 15589 / NCIMB 2235) TaxID=288705 RepID=A9WN84_RENSM|nr:GH25 family lysozyme [Renibacterium salmoninarum]ABY23083.1 lysozyme M1 [Renibacterium salmoninarum ATCC 33209]